MKQKDWVSLIEAGYSLEGNDESWTKDVLDKAVPLFDRGWFPSVATYQYTPTTFSVEHVVVGGPAVIEKSMRDVVNLPAQEIDRLIRSGNYVASVNQQVTSHFPGQQSMFRRITRGLIGDCLGIMSHSGEGHALGFGLGFLRKVTPTAMEKRRWSLMASHLGAGLRLRDLAHSMTLDAAPVEAIFDADGKLQEAREHAKELSSRETLRDTVRQLDRVRTRAGRSDPDAAMQLWEGLVDGRWSLVDYFDTDQRRFVVAIKNDPSYPDPRGLTVRERQIAEFVGLGQSSKEISYTLGISQSAVTNCTARTQTKLGLSSLAELAGFFSPAGLRTKLAEVSLKGEDLLIGAYPLINEDRVKMLTEAERAVLADLVAGSTNGDIAIRRNTSECTVANQVKAIFRKLEVSSRSELTARLQSVA